MDTIILGRTGLKTSVVGLGCGGHSRLGQATGRTEQESIAVVKRALDLGITLVDTARVYGTEDIVGKGIKGRRDETVLSTKVPPQNRESPIDAAALRASLEKSLRSLSTEWVDILHLHGVREDLYDHCADVLIPEMLRLKNEGKIRFLALSEQFGRDTGHVMLQRAVKDDFWDVMMVGFNLLNPSARDRVFPATIAKGVGVLVMFAVRRTLSRPEELQRVIEELIAQGLIEKDEVNLENALGFLVRPEGAASVVDAAYRFARHEPGTDVILTGTGDLAHLEENVSSIGRDPLPNEDLDRLRRLFGHLDSLSGN